MAHYKFSKIESSGFMSFDECQFTIDDLGVVLVEGINKFESMADSNGSGKSALFEMIIWLLTGSTSRGSSEVANTYLNKGVYVRGEIMIDSVNYTITRSKNHEELGSGIKILKEDEDISGDTLTKSKQILDEVLNGLDYDTLTSIIILSQGLPGRLSSLKPASRKSRLEELSNTDQYISDVKSKIDKAIQSLSAEQSRLASEISRFDGVISSSNFNITSTQYKIDDIESKSADSIDKETYDNYMNSIRELDARLNELQTSYATNMNLMATVRNTLSNSDGRVTSLTADLNALKSNYASLHTSSCPTCHQIIGDPNQVEQMKNDINNRMLEYKTELGNLLNHTIPSAKSELEKLSANESTWREEKSMIDSEKAEYIKLTANYKSTSDSIDALKEVIESNKNSINEAKSKKEEVNEQLAVILEQIAIANFYKNQASRKFRSFLLQGVVDYMNKKSNEYSKYLFENQGVVRIEPDGNNLNIYLGNQKFEDLSGGEGRRVDIILQIIQRDLARNQSGLSSNVLVLDEILDYLDASGIDSTIKLLEFKSPDVDSMLVVSHKKDIKIPSDSLFTVVKGPDRISSLRFNGYANSSD